MLKKILSFMNSNHWLLIFGLVIVAGAIYFMGCQSTVPSMIDPGKMVNRDELQTEADFLMGQVRNKLSALDRQDEIRKLITDQAALFAASGSFNPMGLLTLGVSIFSVGAALDSRRKLKEAQSSSAASNTV
jgi:hypothetical protein